LRTAKQELPVFEAGGRRLYDAHVSGTLCDIAARHGLSNAAALVALDGLRRGGGMAQFDHPDLGGRGQWMGGMVMVGRIGDVALRGRVAALFADLLPLAMAHPTERSATEMEPMKPMVPMTPMAPMEPMETSRVDAPADWGEPASAGGQNDVRYAYFSRPRRLVVERGGQRTVYDTADHRITGVAQAQSDVRAGRLVFSSDAGPVALDALKAIAV
jgi:hypothetical protein